MERVYQDIRIFRFNHSINAMEGAEIFAVNPVPILNEEGKLVGFATVTRSLAGVSVACAMDPSTPERLDLETGARRYWIDVRFDAQNLIFVPGKGYTPTIFWVRSLHLTTIPISGQTEIKELV